MSVNKMRIGWFGLIMLALAGFASAADKTWSGTADASWGSAATWTPNGAPEATNSVSLDGDGKTLTIANGVDGVATNIALNNASGNMYISVADGGSLTVGGPITDTGVGAANVSVNNTAQANAGSRLVASSLAAYSLNSSGYLTTGFDIVLAVQHMLPDNFTNNLYTHTNGVISSANTGYGLTFIEAGWYRVSPNTARYVLDGGTLAHDRLGVGNGNGNNVNVPRWIEYGVLTFNNGTIRPRTSNGTVFIQNASGFLTYTNQPDGVKDMQIAVHHPLTIELAQGGTHTFDAQGVSGAIYLSPSVQLVNKVGEAGTLSKTGDGDLIFTGGAPSGNAPDGSAYAVNSYTGATTVTAGRLVVDYNRIAGYAGGGVLSNAYSKGSKMILNGGHFVMTGRPNVGTTSRTANLSATGYDVDTGVAINNSLVVGQPVTHANLPAGTYIRRLPYGTGSTWISLSNMATGTVTGATVQFGAANFSSVQEVDEVDVQSNATVTVNAAGDNTLLTFGAVSGVGGLTKAGAGTLALLGTNSYSGGTTVSGGLLRLGSGAVMSVTNAPLALSGGAFDIAGRAVTNSGFSITGSGNRLFSTGGVGTLVATNLVVNNGSAVLSNLFVDVRGGDLQIVMNTSASLTLDSATVTNARIRFGGSFQPGGSLVLTNGARLYSATAPVWDFWSLWGNIGNQSYDNSVTVTGSGSLWDNGNQMIRLGVTGGRNRLIISDGGVVTNVMSLSVGNNGWNNKSNSVVVSGGGRLHARGGGSQAGEGSGNGGQNYNFITVGGTNSVTGAASVVDFGSQTLILGYLGTIRNECNVNAGGQFICGTVSLNDPSSRLNLDGGAVAVTTINGVGTNYLGNGGAIFDNGSGNTAVFNAIQNASGCSGGLIKRGAGTLTLSGTNTYSGATAVSNGVLKTTHNLALPAGTDVYISAASGAKLEQAFNGTATVRQLFVDGVLQIRNKSYSKASLPQALDGAGLLYVTDGAAPKGTMIRVL
jgi:autotransporter-associated beta strand protein/T5SS/PEP-CTERM-associated repeat protein